MADPISWAVIAYTSVKGAFVMAASSTAFALGASASASLTIGAAAASTFKFAAITAASIAASALFAPNVGASGSPTEWRSDPNAGLPFVAGRLGVAGNLIYSKEFGANNRYLGNVTLYSRAGPVHSMGAFYADGVNITFGSGGVATNGDRIAGNMWLSSQDGLQPQPTALPLPGALSSETFTGWTANHKLSGCAADLQVLRQDSKFRTYPSGLPRRYRVIEGIKTYDPRLDSTFPGGDGACRLNNRATYVYTANPIIHGLNWCIGYYENGQPVGGLADPAGPTLDGIDTDAFISAANIADANAWTGLGARYSTADDKHQVLLGFLQAGGALYAENAGRISCVSRGAVKTSVMTLTRADTAGMVTIDAMPPRRVVINSLIPRCIQETYQWEPVDLEPVTVAALVTADGGVRRRNKDFPFVTSSVQASQLAALDILDAREPLSGSTTFKPYVRDLNPGDAFTWSEPGFLLNGVKCVVMGRSYDPASDTVEITWRSETDSKIAFALGLDPAPPVFPSVAPANPSFVPVPSTDDWDVDGGSIGDDGGPRGPVITIEADPADLTDVTHILVDVRESGDTEWTHHGEFPLAGFRRENIFGLLPNTTYDVRLRYRNAFGVVDDAQETIFLNITTGPQVAQNALAAAAGSALATAIANAQAAADAAQADADAALADASDNARRVQREAEDRLAETATLAAVLLSEARTRADDDSLQQFEIVRVDQRAGDARALAEDIISLSIDPESVLLQRFTTIEVSIGETGDEPDPVGSLFARVSSNALATADLDGVLASYGMSAEAEAPRDIPGDVDGLRDDLDDPETGLATRASVGQLAIVEADAERARSRQLDTQLAQFAAALATQASLRESFADADNAISFQITRTQAALDVAEVNISGQASALSSLDSRVTSAEGTITSQGSAITAVEARVTTNEDDIDGLDTTVTGQGSALTALDGRVTSAEGTITSQGSAITAVEGRLDTVETDVGGLETTTTAQGTALTSLDGRVTSAEGSITAQGSAITAIEAEIDNPTTGLAARALNVDLAEVEVNAERATARSIENTQAQFATALGAIRSLRDVTAEDGSVSAFRIDETRAQLAQSIAEVIATTYTRATLDDAFAAYGLEVTSAFQEDLSAAVSLFLSAFTDGDGNALASLDLITAASGSNPAIVSLRSGDGVSEAVIAADRVMLGNLGDDENEIRPVFLAQDGKALFNEQITIFDDLSTPTTAVILGPDIGTDGLTLWAGAAADASAPTLANAQLALGASGGAQINGTILIDGYEVNRLFSSSPGSEVAVINTDTTGKVIARADLLGVRTINSWALIGSVIDFPAPGTGTMGGGDEAHFKLRVAVANPQASPPNIGDSISGFTSGGVTREWDVSFTNTGAITIKSAIIAGAPTITNDELEGELGELILRYSVTGTCYAYLSARFVSTTASDPLGIVLRFSTSTRIAVTNLLNRNVG